MTVAVAVAAAVVSGLLTSDLGRQWAARRRDHTGVWTLALGCFALACGATAYGLAIGWSVTTYRVFWVCGALTTVPLLATGQMLLLAPRLRTVWLGCAAAAVVVSVWAVTTSPLDESGLAAADAAATVPVGADVWGPSPATAVLSPFNWTGLVVIAGSTWSAWRTRRPAVALIGVGVAVAGAGFAFVRAGMPAAFVSVLATGVVLMWAGVRSVTAARRPVTAAHAADLPA